MVSSNLRFPWSSDAFVLLLVLVNLFHPSWSEARHVDSSSLIDAADVEGSCRALFALYLEPATDSSPKEVMADEQKSSGIDDAVRVVNNENNDNNESAMSDNKTQDQLWDLTWSDVESSPDTARAALALSITKYRDSLPMNTSAPGVDKGAAHDSMVGMDFALALGIVTRMLMSRHGQLGGNQDPKAQFGILLLLHRFQKSQSMLLEHSDSLQEIMREHEKSFQDEFIIPYEDLLGAVDELYAELSSGNVAAPDHPLRAEQQLSSICRARRKPLRLARRLRRSIGAHLHNILPLEEDISHLGTEYLTMIDSLAALNQLCSTVTGLDEQQACQAAETFLAIRNSMEILFLHASRAGR